MKQEAAAVYVRPDELKPWGRNPRKGKPVAEVAESIRRFGFAAPIVARLDGTIIAGHTRWEAAQLLGLDRVPVRFVDLDEQEAAALALADNRLSELAEWDDDGLTSILAELEEASVPIDGLGWDADALRDLLGSGEPVTEPTDDAPAVDDRVVHSRLGEVYELGPHRLVCGDSTQAETWSALLGTERLQMVWTDPPYGVAYVSGSRDPRDTAHYESGDAIENDDLTTDELRGLLAAALGGALRSCEAGAAWYVAAPPGPPHNVFGSVLLDLGVWRRSLLWLKDQFVFGRGDYHYRHEAIFYGWAAGAAHYFTEDRTQDSVLECPNPKGGGRGLPEHPTMKPVALVARCVGNSSKPGWLVGDPFGGSGTTLLAAASLGRVARLIELDPRYCDVIRRRWTRWARENNQDPGPGALDDEVADASSDV